MPIKAEWNGFAMNDSSTFSPSANKIIDNERFHNKFDNVNNESIARNYDIHKMSEFECLEGKRRIGFNPFNELIGILSINSINHFQNNSNSQM